VSQLRVLKTTMTSL